MLELPANFQLKTLDVGYLNEIHSLLNNHYIEDKDKIVRILYSKDYLYWYFKSALIIGLIHKNRLVGIISASIMNMSIRDEEFKIAYINYLCIQRNIRNIGLSKILIKKLTNKLENMNVLFNTYNEIKYNLVCKSDQYIIPINYSKLKKIGFLDDPSSITSLKTNPLHLMKITDVSNLISKLSIYMKNFEIKPIINENFINHYLLPKKNIVYSFVKKNSDNEITDFISVYKYYQYCLDVKEILSVAHLGYYFCTSLNITELVSLLIDKLDKYGFDELIFNDMAENRNINITKFESFEKIFYYSSINENIESNKIFIYPF